MFHCLPHTCSKLTIFPHPDIRKHDPVTVMCPWQFYLLLTEVIQQWHSTVVEPNHFHRGGQIEAGTKFGVANNSTNMTLPGRPPRTATGETCSEPIVNRGCTYSSHSPGNVSVWSLLSHVMPPTHPTHAPPPITEIMQFLPMWDHVPLGQSLLVRQQNSTQCLDLILPRFCVWTLYVTVSGLWLQQVSPWLAPTFVWNENSCLGLLFLEVLLCSGWGHFHLIF